MERLVASQYGTVIAEYYIHCPADGAVKESGPLNVLVRQARLNIDKSSLLVAEFVTLSESYYSPKDVNYLSLLYHRGFTWYCNVLFFFTGIVSNAHWFLRRYSFSLLSQSFLGEFDFLLVLRKQTLILL